MVLSPAELNLTANAPKPVSSLSIDRFHPILRSKYLYKLINWKFSSSTFTAERNL